MEIKINMSAREIGYLVNTASPNFYHEQPDRFEVMEEESEPAEGGQLFWCDTQYLNAKIVAEYYSGFLNADTSIMWDANQEEWVVWVTIESDAPSSDEDLH